MLKATKTSVRAVFVCSALIMTASSAVAQECRVGLLFEAGSGKPVIDPATQKQARCGNTGDQAQSGGMDGGALAAAGATATAMVGGVVGGLAASGAFGSGGSPQPLLFAPQRAPVSGQ